MYKVLLIEDDPPYRKVYTRKFEVAGYQIETAEDGVVGLEKMRTFQPDIVFTDLMMPKMDGFHVLDAIKSDPAFKDTPVIVLTNLSTPDDAQKAVEKGAVAVLVKSDNDPQAIVDKAHEVLSGKKA